MEKFESVKVYNFQNFKVPKLLLNKIRTRTCQSSCNAHFQHAQILRFSVFPKITCLGNELDFLGFSKVSWCLRNEEQLALGAMVMSTTSRDHINDNLWGFPIINLKSYRSKMKQNHYMELSGYFSKIFTMKMSPPPSLQTP